MILIKKISKLNRKFTGAGSEAGFSLVELIVIIAIMVVLIGAGGFSISMLVGAQAKEVANKLVAELNDAKTGTLTRADEDVVIRYIEVPDSDKETYAKLGIDKSGYYADKCVYTIMNNVDSDNDMSTGKGISTVLDEHEYTYLGAKKVVITVSDENSKTHTLTSYGNDSIKIGFQRSTGAFDDLQVGTFKANGNNAVGEFASSGDEYGAPSEIYITAGLKTYTIKCEPKTGKMSIE